MEENESGRGNQGITLRLFPLHTVLFPGMRMPLHIFEPRYRLMIGECLEQKASFGVVRIAEGEEVGGPASMHPVGTTALITESERLPDGRMNILVVGEHRFRIDEILQDRPYMAGRVTFLPIPKSELPNEELTPLIRGLRQACARYHRLMQKLDSRWQAPDRLPGSPVELAHVVASSVPFGDDERQRLLAENRLDALAHRELGLLNELNYQHLAVLVARKRLAEAQEGGSPPISPGLN